MTREEEITTLLKKEKFDFNDLNVIMRLLRSENGCPWDREQDHHTIRNDLIEETYEVIEAIDTENPVLLCEELGDVMLQVVFHSRIEEEKNSFDINDVVTGICQKLIHRHPHVFADTVANTSDEVLKNWEIIKSDEKERKTVTEKLRAVPPQLPALMRATKVGKKAKCFDFPDADSVLVKLDEENGELREAISAGDRAAVEEEMGDLLLTVTSLCRKLDISAEDALNHATDKFINRFETVENTVLSEGKDINELKMSELDSIWDKIKHKNANNN